MTDIIVARYKSGQEKFEVVIDPDKALLYRQGKAQLNDAVRYPAIYFDAKKGESASGSSLKKVFGTDNIDAVAEQIIRKGEVPQSRSQLQEQLEQTKARLVHLLHCSGVDPRTHAPHPPQRIHAALEQAKYRVDPAKTAEAQLQQALSAIRPIIPVKSEMHTMQLEIPASAIGAAMKLVKGGTTVIKEEWTGPGDWRVVVQLPGGLSVDFQESLMAATHGKANFTILRRE